MDKNLLDLEMMKKEDRQKLSFTTQSQLPPGPPVLATVVFKDQDVLRQYEVKIVETAALEKDAAE